MKTATTARSFTLLVSAFVLLLASSFACTTTSAWSHLQHRALKTNKACTKQCDSVKKCRASCARQSSSNNDGDDTGLLLRKCRTACVTEFRDCRDRCQADNRKLADDDGVTSVSTKRKKCDNSCSSKHQQCTRQCNSSKPQGDQRQRCKNVCVNMFHRCHYDCHPGERNTQCKALTNSCMKKSNCNNRSDRIACQNKCYSKTSDDVNPCFRTCTKEADGKEPRIPREDAKMDLDYDDHPIDIFGNDDFPVDDSDDEEFGDDDYEPWW